MTLVRALISLGLVSAHALSVFDPDVHARRGTAAFERRLRDGLTYDLAAALVRAEFRTPDDRAFVTEALRGQPTRGRLSFRRSARAGRGYEVTADNGRTFRLEPGDTSGRVLVNGRALVLTGRPLRTVTRELEAALHQSFVVQAPAWWPAPAAAAAPVIFLVSITALALYQTYEMITADPAAPDPAARAAARLAQLARICDAEREALFVRYDESETARALIGADREDLVDVARLGGTDCEGEVKRAIEVPARGDRPGRVPNPRDLGILCANAAELRRCVEAFRREPPPVQVALPLEGDGDGAQVGR